MTITNLDELELFVLDENNSIEVRFEVFVKTLANYPLFILELKNGASKEIDDSNVLPNMQKVIAELKANNHYPAGFTVQYAKGIVREEQINT